MPISAGHGRWAHGTGRGIRPAIIGFLLRDTNLVIGTVVSSNVLRMISSVVLTRLLMPEAFGAVGLISSISFVLSMISDLGFQAFVVRHRDGDQPRFLDVIWTIRLVRAAALTAILMLLAAPIADLIGRPTITVALAVSAGQFLIDGFSSLSIVTALRERQLARLSATDVKQKIEQALKRSAEVDAKRITVVAEGGTVTLHGRVRSWAEKEQAEHAAWRAPGVFEVKNQIEVDPTLKDARELVEA